MPRTKNFDEKQVLEKAMELFWEKGFHATSIQDLITHLGINRASLYDTFGGKEELFSKAFDQYQSTNREAIVSFFEKEENKLDALRKLFTTNVEGSINDNQRKGCFVVNTTTEMIPGNPNIKPVLESNRAFFEGVFEKYLIIGQEMGKVNPRVDAKIMAGLLFTLFSGLKVIGKIENEQERLLQQVDTIIEMLSSEIL
jgi:TetR/AcrR family transcriptional repressor of nem operon